MEAYLRTKKTKKTKKKSPRPDICNLCRTKEADLPSGRELLECVGCRSVAYVSVHVASFLSSIPSHYDVLTSLFLYFSVTRTAKGGTGPNIEANARRSDANEKVVVKG